MTTTRTTKKQTRTLRWEPLGGYYLGRVTVKDGKDIDGYLVRGIPADWGQAYEVEKLDEAGTTYHVNLDVHAGRAARHSCECLGHLRWGHRTVCRHVAALLKLRERGEL
jgi:hypothetical protein